MSTEELERELEEKCARLDDMMKRLPQVEASMKRMKRALCARTVKNRENEAREATVLMERQLAVCQQANSDYRAAQAASDAARLASCEAAREQSRREYALCEQRMRDCMRRYQEEMRRQGFADEKSYRSALMTLPAQKQLAGEIDAFRSEYAALLTRCNALQSMLDGEKDSEPQA